MNEMQVFNNPEFGAIRTMMIEDEPWAVGIDVAKALKYTNPKDAIKNHVAPEDKLMGARGATPSVMDGKGRIQYPTWVNESGFYSLILSCTNQDDRVKRFKRWVTSEVLPSLRKNGSYSMPNSISDEPRILTPDDYLTAARILAGCRNERLPYVLPLLKKAGIEVRAAVVGSYGGMAKDPNTARLLTDAHDYHGVSFKELERLTGIDNVQLYRMMRGTSCYNAARAAIIREVIHTLVPDMDMSEYAE